MDYIRSVRHVFEEALENLFHFEGKFLVSVAWLLAKPGRLTKEFIQGRRQSQLNPLRFYIFATVLFFLGLNLLHHGHILDFDRKKADEVTEKVQAKAEQLNAEQRQKLKERAAKRADKNGMIDPETFVTLVNEVQAETKNAQPDIHKKAEVVTDSDVAWMQEVGKRLQHKFSSGELKVSTIIDEIEHRIPTMLFLGMPVLALILKILHLGHSRYYVEHLIFSLHVHTWFFVALMVGSGYVSLAALGPSWMSSLVNWAITFWVIWYVVSSFRVVYAQTWLRASVTAAISGAAYTVALGMIGIVLATITVIWIALE